MQNYKSQEGSTAAAAPIVIAISMFLISILIVVCINMLVPFIWYEKLSLESLKYIFIMEEYGYLTQNEKKHLLDELTAEKFSPDDIDVVATDKPTEYGEPIFLNIIYTYTYKFPFLNGNSLSTESREMSIPMIIRRQSVSKR
ncbi:MAG: hypothetical protein ACM3KR_05865 [Deltaproteobacteria bacterium]